MYRKSSNAWPALPLLPRGQKGRREARSWKIGGENWQSEFFFNLALKRNNSLYLWDCLYAKPFIKKILFNNILIKQVPLFPAL